MQFFIIFKKYLRLLRKESLGRLTIVTFIILIIGTFGLSLLEKDKNQNIDSFGDALWWSLVTVTTVGYGDIYPITLGGRIIGAMVMIFGIGFIGMFTATVASIFVERKLRQDRGLKPLKNLSNHVILCGWNYSASEVISEIHADNKDKDIVIIANLNEKPIDEDHTYFVKGDPADVSKLEMACFRTADVAIVLHDESNPGNSRDGQGILTVLAIKREQPNLYVCIQIIDENNVVHCNRAGADEIIVTGGLTAKLLGQAALNHGVTKVVSEILSNKYGNELYKVQCPKSYYGKSFGLILAEFKSEYNGIVLGIERAGELITNPNCEVIIEQGDYLIIIAEKRPEINN